jgi:hypothetical protein
LVTPDDDPPPLPSLFVLVPHATTPNARIPLRAANDSPRLKL